MGESDLEPTGKPFPGYDFDDFDGCVRTFADEPSIDDPEAFCAWLEEEGAEALSDPNADEVLAALEVEFVSAVDRPAQDSEWLIAKNAEDPEGDRHRWQSEVTLYVRKDDADGEDGDGEAKQIAFAPVLVPKEADKDGDVIPKPAIEDAAHTYLAEYRKVDSDHDLRDGKGTPVESWTLKQDTSFERPDGTESRMYPKGTWVMGIKFGDETWDRVLAGELSGLSIYGGAKPIDVDALLQAAKGTESKMKDTDTDADGGTDDGVDECDITPGPSGTVKSEDDVPDWFKKAVKRDEDPCWENYVMVGMKPDPNGNGQVPNCVPEDQADEPDRMGSADMSVVDAWNKHIKEMSNDTDPGDTGNDGTESVEKMLDAGGISDMLASVGEADGLDGSSTIEDFVLHAVEAGDVDEGEIRNMAVLLQDGGGDGGMSPESDGNDDEMSEGDDDEGIDLDADGKSEADGDDDGDDVDKDTDTDADDGADAPDGDVEKSVGDGDAGDVFDDAPEWAQALKSEVDDLREKVDDEPTADKMSTDDLSDRVVKDITGYEDADVARKAVREQVEKNEDDAPSVDYEGITEDEGVDAEAKSPDTDGSGSLPNSKAANTRMAGGN